MNIVMIEAPKANNISFIFSPFFCLFINYRPLLPTTGIRHYTSMGGGHFVLINFVLQILEIIFPYFLDAVYIKSYYKLRFTLIIFFLVILPSTISVYLAIESPTLKLYLFSCFNICCSSIDVSCNSFQQSTLRIKISDDRLDSICKR